MDYDDLENLPFALGWLSAASIGTQDELGRRALKRVQKFVDALINATVVPEQSRS